MPSSTASDQFTPSSKQARELLRIGPFGGIDATSGATYIPDECAADALNVVPNRTFASYRPIRPVASLASTFTSNYNGPINAMALFIRSQTGSPAEELLGAIGPTSGAGLMSLQSLNLTYSSVWTNIPLPSYGSTLHLGPFFLAVTTGGTFTPMAQFMFYSERDPNGIAFKIDSSNNATIWQISAPATGPVALAATLVFGAGGMITAANVYYTFTYSNAVQESSPCYFYYGATSGATNVSTQPAPPCGPFNPTAQSIQLDFPISWDPQVTTINIYRISNGSAQWLLVGTIPNTSNAGGGGTGQSRFIDNIADPPSGQALVQHRDPPAPFYATTTHKGFIFGFGHDAFLYYYGCSCTGAVQANETIAQSFNAGPSDLWYSVPGEPWSFDNTNQVIQINPNNYGDVAVNLASVGGCLVLLKTRSTWVLYGDSAADFQPPQEVGRNIGCVSKQSVFQALGMVYWLSNQGIMQFDGSTLTNISHAYGKSNIKAFLDGLSAGDMAACATTLDDGVVWFSFPTVQLSYGYHIASQSWWKANFYSALFATDPDSTASRNTALDDVYAVDYTTSTGNVLHLFDGTATYPATAYYSKTWTTPSPHWWRFTWLKITIAQSFEFVGGNTITVTVISNPNATSTETFTRSITEWSRNPYIMIHLPQEIQGTQVNMSVSALAGDVYLEITSMTLYGYPERELNDSLT